MKDIKKKRKETENMCLPWVTIESDIIEGMVIVLAKTLLLPDQGSPVSKAEFFTHGVIVFEEKIKYILELLSINVCYRGVR